MGDLCGQPVAGCSWDDYSSTFIVKGALPAPPQPAVLCADLPQQRCLMADPQPVLKVKPVVKLPAPL